MPNGFALSYDKSLQIYVFCVKRQAKNDFLKDVESTVVVYVCSSIPMELFDTPRDLQVYQHVVSVDSSALLQWRLYLWFISCL